MKNPASPFPASPRFPRHRALGISVLALTALAVAGCGKHREPTAVVTELPAVRVQLATARIQSAPVPTAVTGTIRATERAQLAARVMGAITELPVTLGQRVAAGDVLVRISAAEIPARVLQAQSQLNLVRRDLARERDLLVKGASTADMVKGLEDRFAMTEAMVGEAEAMLAYTTIRAPFAGVVAQKFVHAGDLAAPGQPLLEVESAGTYEVEAALPDSLAELLHPGDSLAVSVPVAGVTFIGTLAELSSSADASAHTVSAKIAVPAGTAVRSGQFARIEVPGAPVASLWVPAAAVSTVGQLERVFVSGPDQRAVLRLVKTGARRGDRVEILSGLDDGEQVVVNGTQGLREGQRLQTDGLPPAPAATAEARS